MASNMDRITKSRQIGPKISLIITTALAGAALAGCSASTAPSAGTTEASFSKARTAPKSDKSIANAEAAVLAEPRNPAARAMLGAAYLEAGRFEAAATSFKDALDLGDTDPRTALSYALAATAIGDGRSALAALNSREGSINPADFGLAVALAGNPEKGIHVLTNAVRSGQNTAKVRQNLAYTYALAGNWRAARVMAAEDVPADQLDGRLTEWASVAKPEDVMKRVANLLGVQPVAGGQPARLALANFPDQPIVFAQAEEAPARELGDADLAQAPAETASEPAQTAPARPTQSEALAFRVDSDVEERSSLAVIDPTVGNILRATGAQTVDTAAPTAMAASSDLTRTAIRYISSPVIQALPSKAAQDVKAPVRMADASSQRRMAPPAESPAPSVASDKAASTHLVQLGSYSSRAQAQQGWTQLQKKFPQLKGHDVVITKAEVSGKIYYRVAAAGFGPRSARSLCGTVKSSGRGCFAYAATNPPKGAIDNGVRIAARMP